MIGPGSGSAKGKRRILLIDQDPAAGRKVSLSLGGPQSEIFIASDPPKGMVLAASKKPDLVLMETRFKDADGIDMARKLLRSPGNKGVAVVFLTDDDSVARRFKGIQAGAADYILKEVEGKQLSARLAAILNNIGKPRPRPTLGPRGKELLERITTYEQQAKSATITLKRPGQSASISFSFGEVQKAQCGPKEGPEALNEIAAHENWTASFKEDVVIDKSETTAPEHAPPIVMKRSRGQLDKEVTEPTLPALSEDLIDANVSPLVEQLFEEGRDKNISLLDPEQSFRLEDHQPPEREEDTDRTLMDSLEPSIVPTSGAYQREDPTQAEVPSGKLGLLLPPATIKQSDTDDGLKELRSLLDADASSEHTLSLESTFKEGEETPTNTFPSREAFQISPQPPEGAKLSLGVPSSGSTENAQWIASLPNPNVLLVLPKGNVCDALKVAVAQLGFKVASATTGLEAYTSTLKKRPQAIISETHGVKVDGRELLTAVRSDFLIRETAFLMVSVEHLAEQINTGAPQALDPILRGLEASISAKAHFHCQLNTPDFVISGRVEPIGIAHLLREISRVRLSGRLSLNTQSFCQAEVLIAKGSISSVTIDEGQIVMGPMAFLHLLGYEWQEYSFSKDTAAKKPALGDTRQLVEVACELNNHLLYSLYQNGISTQDVNIDRKVLDAYLQTLPFGTLKVLIRLVEGEKAVILAEQGVATPGILKSFLHDFRRKGVFRLTSLDMISSEVSRLNQFSQAGEGTQRSSRSRWWVALFTTLITVALAAGGYWGYQRFLQGQTAQPGQARPESGAAPSQSSPRGAGDSSSPAAERGPDRGSSTPEEPAAK